MHSQFRNFAVFSEAVYIYVMGQIWLDASDAEAKAKCSVLICVTSAVMTVILPSFSTRSVKSIRFLFF